MLDRLESRLKSGFLPGAKAHDPLRALPIGANKPLFEHETPPRPGGVLILLFEENGLIKFPLIKRPDYPGLHGGQISLPGGKSEKGESAIQTALREANEEIGIKPDLVRVLGTLSDFYVIPSNYMVTPVISLALEKPAFIADEHEVEKIIIASVNDLIDDDAVKQKEILVANRYSMMAPHFSVENHVVWGATAMMLNEFRIVLNEVIKS